MHGVLVRVLATIFSFLEKLAAGVGWCNLQIVGLKNKKRSHLVVMQPLVGPGGHDPTTFGL